MYRSGVRIPLAAPFSAGSVPDTWVTGDIGNGSYLRHGRQSRAERRVAGGCGSISVLCRKTAINLLCRLGGGSRWVGDLGCVALRVVAGIRTQSLYSPPIVMNGASD